MCDSKPAGANDALHSWCLNAYLSRVPVITVLSSVDNAQ